MAFAPQWGFTPNLYRVDIGYGAFSDLTIVPYTTPLKCCWSTKRTYVTWRFDIVVVTVIEPPILRVSTASKYELVQENIETQKKGQ